MTAPILFRNSIFINSVVIFMSNKLLSRCHPYVNIHWGHMLYAHFLETFHTIVGIYVYCMCKYVPQAFKIRCRACLWFINHVMPHGKGSILTYRER